MGQVKASQKLAKSDMHEEKERHSEEVAKLKQQTTGLRNHMKNQREKTQRNDVRCNHQICCPGGPVQCFGG
jgi:hypothetical protein